MRYGDDCIFTSRAVARASESWPISEERGQARTRLDLPKDAFVVGSIGRLDKQKRPWMLVRTLAYIRDAGLDAYLVMVGQGPLEQDVRSLARQLEVHRYIRFPGFVHDVERLMPAFDIHLLLSRNEGFGIVTAEAMAAGIPALGSDVPGTHDVLSGSAGGLLLHSDEESEIAAEVLSLLGSSDRLSKMAHSGRDEIEARFHRERTGMETFSVYQGVFQGLKTPC